MKSFFKAKYLLTIEDQTKLEKIVNRRFSIFSAVLSAAAVIIAAMVPCIFLILLTPIHNLLPGYLKDSERAKTEENIMRIDSIKKVYERNEAYFSNILTLLNTSRIPSDSSARVTAANNLTPDSLKSASEAEKKFNAAISRREQYNFSVLAPLNAEGMNFYPINSEGVISSDSRNSPKAKVIVPSGSPVGSIADGRVIEVAKSASEGASIIIAHSKGFISRISNLGQVFAEPGDYIEGAQIIALPSRNKAQHVTLEMWHNGTRLLPWQYVGSNNN